MNELELKYGCNPNQKPARIFMKDGELPIKVLSGRPGYINFLDAFNGWQLVRELKRATGLPAAASFKHVSPAGAAVGLPLSDVLRRIYFIAPDAELSPLACAYARARGADRILTGSLVNAAAIARYLRAAQPETVSLVCMGIEMREIAPEDLLCAEYIRALLLDEPLDVRPRAAALRETSGARFFLPDQQEDCPSRDFTLCTDVDRFPFVLEIVRDAARDAHVQLRQVEYRTQGRDHPILPAAPETQYLKCGIFQLLH